MRRRIAIAGAVIGTAAGITIGRTVRWWRAWGVDPTEAAKALAGDDLVPTPTAIETRGITIDAPPEAVWPWLVQMGCDRAGFYSWDRLDNGGRPSASRIHPEWQTLAVGDRVLCTPDGRFWFDVERLESERVLVLRSSIDLGRRQPFDTSEPRPRFFADGIWEFVLAELPEGKTRLVVRSFGIARPRLLGAVNLVFWDPAHVVMQTRQLRNLKRLVESPLQEPVLVAAA